MQLWSVDPFTLQRGSPHTKWFGSIQVEEVIFSHHDGWRKTTGNSYYVHNSTLSWHSHVSNRRAMNIMKCDITYNCKQVDTEYTQAQAKSFLVYARRPNLTFTTTLLIQTIFIMFCYSIIYIWSLFQSQLRFNKLTKRVDWAFYDIFCSKLSVLVGNQYSLGPYKRD